MGPARSEWQSLVKGVPQGSILGPGLFNLFLTDYLYFVRSSVVNYAVDNTICVTGETLDDCLNSCVTDIDISLDWFELNQMQANPSKFQFKHTCKDAAQPFRYNDITLDAGKSVKLLGIEIDQRLTFTTHVDTLIRKCACQLNTLKRQCKMLNIHTKSMICNAFIEANFSTALSYGWILKQNWYEGY